MLNEFFDPYKNEARKFSQNEIAGRATNSVHAFQALCCAMQQKLCVIALQLGAMLGRSVIVTELLLCQSMGGLFGPGGLS